MWMRIEPPSTPSRPAGDAPAQASARWLPALHRACARCLCEAATGCERRIGSQGGYCGPFGVSRLYWHEAGRPVLPHDDPDRKEGESHCHFSTLAPQGPSTRWNITRHFPSFSVLPVEVAWSQPLLDTVAIMRILAERLRKDAKHRDVFHREDGNWVALRRIVRKIAL